MGYSQAMEGERYRADFVPRRAPEGFRPRQVELLDRLEAYFFAHGYRSAPMERLARELRCSKRALYELAPSRPDLFALIVDRWTRRVLRLGQTARKGEVDPRRQLAAYLEPGVVETAGIQPIFLEDLHALPQTRAILADHQSRRMQDVRDIIENGKKSGHFKSVHATLVAAICLATIERINDPGLLREAELSFSDAFKELYAIVLNGIDR